LVNLLDLQETALISAGGKMPPITLPGSSAEIFIPQAQVLPLDPVVAEFSPAHDAHAVAPATPVIIQFAGPMDASSVESAFTTAPGVHGDFSWSAARDQMTFTPRGAGFPSQTMIAVQIAETARALNSGNHLRGGFAARFQTGSL
jgi:hypothetical protein